MPNLATIAPVVFEDTEMRLFSAHDVSKTLVKKIGEGLVNFASITRLQQYL